ncbi:MAG: hypothetical protein F4103_13455 [Boseongicola sp. SB0673_bin_14]|nr:hypothetical protein [Boseongicola sp. SB0673_bin_14]
MPLKVGIIRASLPSYFPERHGVFEACIGAVEELVTAVGGEVCVAPNVPMDGAGARSALEHCRDQRAGFALLIHGGFTMGDVAREVAMGGMPMGVWATPEPTHENDIQLNNFVSLNMSLSIARGVRDLSRNPVQWYFGAPEDLALRDRLSRSLRALSARESLRGARIGVVGGLAPTFYNMEVSGDALARNLGVEAVHVDIHGMVEAMAAADGGEVESEIAAMGARGEIRGVSDEQMALTARAALALRKIAGRDGYDGLAVSDWPALQESPGMHPGAAFSWLEEKDNMAIASEGDVLGTVTQVAVRSITGRVGSLLDMTSPQFSDDRILMWHGGGGPLYMARDGRVAWINHPMIGRGTREGPRFGAIADFEFADGPHSVLRVARSGSAAFAVEGQVRAMGETGFTGCRGWVTGFSDRGEACSAEDVVTSVMEHGLEHHFVLVPGPWAGDFLEFAAWAGMECLPVIPAHGGLPPRSARTC